jgi:hypothetical protein
MCNINSENDIFDLSELINSMGLNKVFHNKEGFPVNTSPPLEPG